MLGACIYLLPCESSFEIFHLTMSKITLDQLPPEIFLLICDHLNARFISETLSCVCRRFKELIDDEIVWKSRMLRKWMKRIPTSYSLDSTFDWKEACIEREEHYERWSSKTNRLSRQAFPQIHISDIDAIHVLTRHPTLLASGSRDRGFCLWNLENWPDNLENMLKRSKPDAHEGWIWCLESSESQLFSGSWDRKIKVWDLETCDLISTFQCSWTVFSLAVDNHCVYGGSSPHLYKIDLRSPDPQTFSHHKGPIFSVVAQDYWVLSASEDSTIKAFDLRNNSVFFKHKFNSYPSCLSYGHGQIWAGDGEGNLHLINPQNWTYVTCMPGLSTSMIKVRHSLGSTLAYSKQDLFVLEPTVEAQLIRQITMPKGEISGVATYGNTLLVSVFNDILGWIPRNSTEVCD